VAIAGAPAEAAAANDEIYAMFEPLIDERRRAPRDDIISMLVEGLVDGRPLTRDELLGYCAHLVVAGNDTTTNLIGTGVKLLAEHPATRDALVRDPALIPPAIEEMLRFDGPVQMLLRRTARAVELHGVTIPPGALVELYWGAANRDERELADPDRFDVRRADPRHVAFGHGIHFCLGAHLARLEARVAFEELLARAPRYRLVEGQPFPLKPGWAVRGYEQVLIDLG
jgi:cytochrome P450